MEEIGIVKSIEGVIAKVVVERKSICDQCTVGTCKVTEGGAEIDALNSVSAHVGQKVRVVLKPYTYLKGSMIVYGVPVLALIIGAILGKEIFSQQFDGIDSDIVSAIFGFGAFIISFIAIKLWSNKLEKKIEIKPVIEEILND
ncbi:MAG: SoxR reducing system RseC family protein [Nitrospirota bacterium]